MSDLVWMECHRPDWQQLGSSELKLLPREPPACALSASAAQVLATTEPVVSQQPLSIPIPRTIHRPKWLSSPTKLSQRTPTHLKSSFPGNLRNRSQSPVSPAQVHQLSRELDHAEKVSKNVVDRIEALKRKATAVIHVL